MKKRIFALLLTLALLAAFASCTQPEGEPQGTNDPTVTTAEVTQRPVITKAPTSPQETVTPKPDVPTPDLNGILGEDTAGVGEELPWQD